ncbi:MAG: ABC transporter substrate-binding protein [Acidimicrobiia bacterium]
MTGRVGRGAFIAAIAATMLAGACGGDSGGDAAAGEEATGGTAGGGASAESLLDGEIACDQQHAGKEVTIFSPTRDSDTDKPVADFVAAYQPLVDCTGVKIVWEGTDQFETEIKVRIDGGNAPDVIDFPQPGLLASLAKKGQIPEVPANIAKHTNEDFIAGWAELSTVDGKVYGLPARANVKSLVWYSPAAFAEGGYEIPETLDELTDLSDKIVADGGTPWCAGIESGVATGWPVTDWFEDMMLRINGPEVYDQWVNHEIPFDDAKVKAAADAVGSFLKNPDYLGGENAVKAIATTKFQEGGFPILDGSCFMHRQASFYSGLWPEGTEIGPDGAVDFFYLPVAKAGDDKVMLGAGDIYTAGQDKPEAWDVLLYTGSLEYAQAVLESRKEISPRKDIDPSTISDPLTKRFQELLVSSDVFRFDGSDMMPGAVGAGTFWTEVTAWIVGGDTDTMLENIEASWPASTD